MLMTALLVLLVVAGPTSVLAQSLEPAREPVEVGTAQDIRAQIEIQRSTYALGDTACVRISLVNTSDRRVGLVATTGPSDMVHLVIKRNGQLVKSNVEPAGSASAMGASLPPRGVMRLAHGQWVPITYWGYRVDEAGSYTIEGIPQLDGPSSSPDTITVRSNQVAFTLSRNAKRQASCKVVAPSQMQQSRPVDVRTLSDSLRTATMAKIRAVVDTANWRHDTTVK